MLVDNRQTGGAEGSLAFRRSIVVCTSTNSPVRRSAIWLRLSQRPVLLTAGMPCCATPARSFRHSNHAGSRKLPVGFFQAQQIAPGRIEIEGLAAGTCQTDEVGDG